MRPDATVIGGDEYDAAAQSDFDFGGGWLNIGRCRWQGGVNKKAKIIITPKKAVLDPQGKTVQGALEHMGFKGIGSVHVGKYLEIELPDSDKVSWNKQIDEACHKILSNPVIEDYRFEIE